MAKGHSFVQWPLSLPWKKQNEIFSSIAAVSSAFVVSFFAMVTIIAVGSFFVAVPLVFAPVMVSVLSGFFFGHVVHCSFLLRLVSVPRF